MDGADLVYDRFFDRDLSWLSFNERVLMEAGKESVPIMERIKFLSIYSSNLDEFYRVRMPVLMALHRISSGHQQIDPEYGSVVKQAREIIAGQLQLFGSTLRDIVPLLEEHNINLVFGKKWPQEVDEQVLNYFYSQVLSFLQPGDVMRKSYFPENNKLYFLVVLKDKDDQISVLVLNIPSDSLERFFSIRHNNQQVIIFLDDIIRYNLYLIFPAKEITGCYSFKINRDAELDLKDEYPGELSDQIEKQLSKRYFGHVTRFLHEPGIPLRVLELVIQKLNLQFANVIEGGIYHNLKDLASLPVHDAELNYSPWPAVPNAQVTIEGSLFDQIAAKDIIFHPPYHTYDAVLRFFNEAAINPDVNEIYTTLYRVASDSRIVNALISAARNGKTVQVVIELKARFDEENNLKWARKLKKAGAEIIYSITALKVHAKIALVKFRKQGRVQYLGLLATGNLNESTARFYTDHILMTGRQEMLREMELLFIFLAKRKLPQKHDPIVFNNLLVAQFNLQQRFIELIDREITHAKQGLKAYITIKLNNLEEERLIAKLYEASRAGIKVNLIVRSICCLIPGVKGMSENISVKRIVDRYLEHGRVFIFYNNGDQEVYMGSADWMNRNIHHRIEVCFPVYDKTIKQELLRIVELQLKDNVAAVKLDHSLQNVAVKTGKNPVQSQKLIYELISSK